MPKKDTTQETMIGGLETQAQEEKEALENAWLPTRITPEIAEKYAISETDMQDTLNQRGFMARKAELKSMKNTLCLTHGEYFKVSAYTPDAIIEHPSIKGTGRGPIFRYTHTTYIGGHKQAVNGYLWHDGNNFYIVKAVAETQYTWGLADGVDPGLQETRYAAFTGYDILLTKNTEKRIGKNAFHACYTRKSGEWEVRWGVDHLKANRNHAEQFLNSPSVPNTVDKHLLRHLMKKANDKNKNAGLPATRLFMLPDHLRSKFDA